jgi:hypothetical protein
MESKSDIFYQINNTDTPRHRNCKPPEEAYRFIPKDSQIVLIDNKRPERTLRRIFQGITEFTQYENEKIQQLLQEIKIYNQNPHKHKDFIPLIFPKNWQTFDTLRFLQATMYKIDQTIKLLIQHITWKKSYFPYSINSKVIEILKGGFTYIHGRDNQYRPIMIINAKFYVDNMNKFIYEDWLCSVVFVMEYMINNLLIPGQVENWNMITDCNGVSLLTLPKDMKNIMTVLSSNYRCRLFVNFLLGMSTVLNFVWKIVKNFLEETTVKKIRFLKKGYFDDVFEFINKDQVELKYGGTAPNLQYGDYFPPHMPSNNFNNDKSKLISEEEYEQLVKENKLTTISPYYLEKKEKEKEYLDKKTLSEEPIIVAQPEISGNYYLFSI